MQVGCTRLPWKNNGIISTGMGIATSNNPSGTCRGYRADNRYECCDDDENNEKDIINRRTGFMAHDYYPLPLPITHASTTTGYPCCGEQESITTYKKGNLFLAICQ
jgi:hypothetical protein